VQSSALGLTPGALQTSPGFAVVGCAVVMGTEDVVVLIMGVVLGATVEVGC